MSPVSRGVHRRHQDPAQNAGRVPPGQYVTKDFPVLSAGPTPHADLDRWSFSVRRGGQQKSWSWAEFRALPSQDVTVDIHCVTKWSKLDTAWPGVSLDDVIYQAELERPCPGVEFIHTLTRHQPPGWAGYARRADAALLAEVAWPAAEIPLACAGGPTSFAETVSQALVQSGYPPEWVKTERFGATGGT